MRLFHSQPTVFSDYNMVVYYSAQRYTTSYIPHCGINNILDADTKYMIYNSNHIVLNS